MRRKKELPFSFVLEELLDSGIASQVRTRAMFGSHAVYVEERIVFILRQRQHAKTIRDNGVWVATAPAHTASVRRQYPALREIELFAARGKSGFAGWLNLPASDEAFEETALDLCRLVIHGDPRVGKIPKKRSKRD